MQALKLGTCFWKFCSKLQNRNRSSS